ncbi:vancomycin resistance protein YoaR [Halopolyspora algeriensis]|uniref:Vancomycin resistance protein YoaR n=1 Tax=Halopolyspora algeriensis TaxID=1500506 RepID=A0A368VZ05_9ACTN|nr:VanW family protein [Halopolyspora algeriensis]RCW47181.1 vancomycin resistance protein YoaR [Halopolyspora algeriensis]TQM48267.1 vancomycin resistance protein YoaR [Halopolyspora algeriensis]
MPEDDEYPDHVGAGSDDHVRSPTERMDRQAGSGDGNGESSGEEPGQESASPSESKRESGGGSAGGERTVRISGGLAGPEEPTHSHRDPSRPGPSESDSERTQRIPAVPAEPTDAFSESDTERIHAVPADEGLYRNPAAESPTVFTADGRTMSMSQAGGAVPPPGPADGQQGAAGEGGRNRARLLRAGVAAGIAVVLLALLYLGDLAFSSGLVPRGTTVAGVDIGGLNKAAAERRLRAELGPSLDEPIRLRSGDAEASIDPAAVGLSLDWRATLDRAGSQPLNPITRVTSFFTTREIGPVSNVDRDKLTAALQEVKPELQRKPKEGTIKFEGTEPVAVEPTPGRKIDMQRALDVIVAEWTGSGAVRLPSTSQPVSTTSEGVHRALNEIAVPAVSAPVTVLGDGAKATLDPEAIADSLRFEPDGKGGLKAHIDVPTAVEAVKPQLAETIKQGKDASFVIEGGKPVVQPSVHGRTVNWEKSFAPLIKVLRQQDGRQVRAVYEDQPAKLTTEEAKQLGIKEQVSTFTTGGFSPDSGVNIKRVAEEVDGAIVKPGETFSLNGYTGVRQKPQGYIASGIIKDGRPAKAVGGGISQFATTLFNASYFAGMKDIEHREHSYYISRYPMGREATVFQQPDGTSLIDVKFKNVSDSGILIETAWTPQSVTVTFWGTKQFEVTSHTSPKSNFKPPEVVPIPPGEPCSPAGGQKGFTVYNTRTVKNLKTGEVTKQRERTDYEPQPIVKCGQPPTP